MMLPDSPLVDPNHVMWSPNKTDKRKYKIDTIIIVWLAHMMLKGAGSFSQIQREKLHHIMGYLPTVIYGNMFPKAQEHGQPAGIKNVTAGPVQIMTTDQLQWKYQIPV